MIDLRYVITSERSFHEIIVNFTDLGDSVCERPELVPAYLNELEKFGIISIEDESYLKDETLYTPLENHKTIVSLKTKPMITSKPGKYEVHKKNFKITSYGKSFIKSCVYSK